jgi:hypothetical protein
MPDCRAPRPSRDGRSNNCCPWAICVQDEKRVLLGWMVPLVSPLRRQCCVVDRQRRCCVRGVSCGMELVQLQRRRAEKLGAGSGSRRTGRETNKPEHNQSAQRQEHSCAPNDTVRPHTATAASAAATGDRHAMGTGPLGKSDNQTNTSLHSQGARWRVPVTPVSPSPAFCAGALLLCCCGRCVALRPHRQTTVRERCKLRIDSFNTFALSCAGKRTPDLDCK